MAGTSDPALFFDDWALTDDGVTCPYCLKFGYTKEYSRPGVRANHIKSCLNRGRYEARCPKPAFSAAAYKPTLVTPPQGDQGAGPAPDHSFGDNDPAPPDDDGNHSPGPGPTREQLVDRFSIRFADLVLNGNGGQGFSRNDVDCIIKFGRDLEAEGLSWRDLHFSSASSLMRPRR